MGTPYDNGLRDGRVTKEDLVRRGWTKEVAKEGRLSSPQEILYHAASLCLANAERNYIEEMAKIPGLNAYGPLHEQYMNGLIKAERDSLKAIMEENS